MEQIQSEVGWLFEAVHFLLSFLKSWPHFRVFCTLVFNLCNYLTYFRLSLINIIINLIKIWLLNSRLIKRYILAKRANWIISALLSHVKLLEAIQVKLFKLSFVTVFIYDGFVFDPFGSLCKFQSGNCFLYCHLIWIQSANYYSFWISSERVFQQIGKFWLSVVNDGVLLLRLKLCKVVDHSSKKRQRLVNFTSLLESHAFCLSVFGPLTSCQVNYVKFWTSHSLLGIFVKRCGFNVASKNGMRPWAFSIHVSWCHRSVVLTFVYNIHHFLNWCHDNLLFSFKVNSFFGVLSNLELWLPWTV